MKARSAVVRGVDVDFRQESPNGQCRSTLMFYYPIPIPIHTLYQELGVDPEAPASEVRNARADVINALKHEKDVLDAELETVYAQVEGMRNAYAVLEEQENKGAHADADERRAAHKAVITFERKALQINPKFKVMRAKSTDLDAKIKRLNSVSIDSPEKRKEYDAANPPLSLVKLAEPPNNVFTDNKTALFMLRHELAAFLNEAGEEVFHPSDFTRTDFSGDFSHNLQLDGPQS